MRETQLRWDRLAGPLGLHTGLLGESQRAQQASFLTFTHLLGNLPLRLVKRVPVLAFTGSGDKGLGEESQGNDLETSIHYTSSLPSYMTCLCIRGGPTSGGLVCLVRPALPLHVALWLCPAPETPGYPELACLHTPYPGVSYMPPAGILHCLDRQEENTPPSPFPASSSKPGTHHSK